MNDDKIMGMAIDAAGRGIDFEKEYASVVGNASEGSLTFRNYQFLKKYYNTEPEEEPTVLEAAYLNKEQKEIDKLMKDSKYPSYSYRN